ncbi:hypothetical protein EYZ11_000435 [Aspergillus tanneri]|uniref:Uncharacterized protein n=1 Tax=Aspergillus tanneri TaxID=1220188 RepID=A0A4S3JX63_9EURO|nr:hypothetical protein EYZ11_000435 [Aspergillus tanneri]
MDVFLFGCQCLSFTRDDFLHLRAVVLDDHGWALQVLAELPVYYHLAAQSLPQLNDIPGYQQLVQLHERFRSGDLAEQTFPPPYIQLAPLLMLTHFTQYAQYKRWTKTEPVENVGFCIGLLSAVVASLDEEYVAVAVRLAMILGALGDAQQMNEEYTSLATVLKENQDLSSVLADYESTITVYYDINRITITTPRRHLSPLQNALESVGCTCTPVDFNGRYHWPGHRDTVQTLISLCDAVAALQLPDASHLIQPTRTNKGDIVQTSGPLHHLVIQSILAEPCHWYDTFSAVHTTHLCTGKVIEFGPERCVPPSFFRTLRNRIIHFADLNLDALSRLSPLHSTPRVYDDDIAIVGMSCRVAGADSLEEFWHLLCSGQSQHKPLPHERYINFETPWRPDAVQKKWYGNFIRDIDAFDHRFFKKVPREAMSLDPQQRLILQVAYQALEQSGYFQSAELEPEKKVGCYIASCTVDYENNVNCHPASAYAATGLLRSFMAGKLSHYFGWRGPAFCIDSACSGSAVALHHACQAVIRAYDNLAGASFVSPTGPCKPFDETADGYCRGEGFAAIVIKRMRDAMAAGDVVLGTIAATAVEQNDNCTPIVVPDATSLAGLFDKVMRKARLSPRDISVVEAHGTGTQAGDPAEYSSVKQTLGSAHRKEKSLALGSVKGLVGHTEGVSGLIALVKVVLMINKGWIPPQPNFHSLNPLIQADEGIEIVTALKPWTVPYRAALINNYGASGSNASMVLTQAPLAEENGKDIKGMDTAIQPVRFCALDEHRIRDYAGRLVEYIHSNEISLGQVAFHLSRQSNPMLDRHAVFACLTLNELENRLTTIISGDETCLVRKKPARPVILCFGGQISTSIGLDRSIYDIPLYRRHLDECDAIVQSLGYDSLYPGIFQHTTADPVQLQTQLFSLQYACARSWMDSGLPVTAVVGHSFGELTALCISGALSLSEAMRMVAHRAVLIRGKWDDDPGGMLAVEGSEEEINRIIQDEDVSIACYNAARSFTLAGPSLAIDRVQQRLSGHRVKRLNVTHAFHCRLVDGLLPSLAELSSGLALQQPSIHLECATQHSSSMTNTFVADHLRGPVYFHQAVQRLSQRYGDCVWLEAGSNSSVAVMASKAVDTATGHYFESVNITHSQAMNSLADTTIRLWKEGISVRYWGHHPQTVRYPPLFLPPYQFEKSRHWMENKKLPSVPIPQEQEEVYAFLGYQDEVAKFRINTSHPRYLGPISGHFAADTAPLAPASVLLDLVIEALHSLPEGTGKIPVVEDVTSETPLCLDPSREVWIELHPDKQKETWTIHYLSEDLAKGIKTRLLHCSARITLHTPNDAIYVAQFARYKRLISHRTCAALLYNTEVDDILQGRNIYRAFSEIINYSTPYRGVHRLVGKDSQSAGRVCKKYNPDTWADAYLVDAFSQVGGFWVNCMTDRDPEEIYIASGMEMWMRCPAYADKHVDRPETWDVLGFHRRDEGGYTSDVFVFEPQGDLVEVFLGLRYSRIRKRSFIKILQSFSSKTYTPDGQRKTERENKETGEKGSVEEKVEEKPKKDIKKQVKAVVAEFCAMNPEDIHDDGNMADAGVDSLMAMELAREMEDAFQCSLPATDLMEAETFRDLVQCVQSALGIDHLDTQSVHEPESEPEPELGAQSHMASQPQAESDRSSSRNILTPEYSDTDLHLSMTIVLESFGETKALTDQFLAENQCSGRVHAFAPLQLQLCVTLTLEAFEELGDAIRSAPSGQRLTRIPFDPQHRELVEYLYKRLEEARIIDINNDQLIRTAITSPTRSSSAILEEISRTYPEYAGASKLSFYTGRHLAQVLRGEQDGLQLIFGTKEGQDLVSWMYGNEPHNVSGYKQMLDFIQRVVQTKRSDTGPLKILEMGAGTGGGTKWFLPGLANLDIPVEYTFTDISPGFVAQARRRFKEYPFMRYRVHDIEQPPGEDLLGTQHIVIASNAVHATSNLQTSTRYIRQTLREDGVLLMLEMTRPVFAVDIVFGLFRGWWVFNDGRHHAITNESRWEADLHAAGYGHVDWTDGHSPEVSVQRVIFATASGEQCSRLPVGKKISSPSGVNNEERGRVVEEYVRRNIKGFAPPTAGHVSSDGYTVLVTGGTGSLGSHLVARLMAHPSVQTVICVNRKKGDALERQKKALEERGLQTELSKLRVLETNTADAHLGLSAPEFERLKHTVTHIVHNAWPMNGAKGVSSFEGQFQTMRNLVNLAREAAFVHREIGFQFISSIGTVGRHPLLSDTPDVPEEKVSIDSVLSNGYSEAKFICERILDETLHLYPDRFKTMTIRPGQIAGSSVTGYWNPTEHLPALIKSAQTLKLLPDLQGLLSWTPVDEVANVLVDLLFTTEPYPVYHIDNPVRQSWSDMVSLLTEELNIPAGNIVPFPEWIHRVKAFLGGYEDNPARVMADWLDDNFERMSCGGVLLDTSRAREQSCLASVDAVSPDVTRRYLSWWRERGFLTP